MRRQIPLLITFVVGVVMISSMFMPRFGVLDTVLTDYFMILAAFALVLGAGNLIQVHFKKISGQKKGWGFSAVIILSFFFTLWAGLLKVNNPRGDTGPLDEPGSWFGAVYEHAFTPLSATMFSLLAFYVASASYRAFRAKNPEATMLLLAAFFVLLGRTVVGAFLTATFPGIVEFFFAAILGYLGYRFFRSKRPIVAGLMWLVAAGFVIRTLYGYFVDDFAFVTIPNLVNWIMMYPQMAGQRAIMIGIALGVISMSLRLILGVERSHLGSDN